MWVGSRVTLLGSVAVQASCPQHSPWLQGCKLDDPVSVNCCLFMLPVSHVYTYTRVAAARAQEMTAWFGKQITHKKEANKKERRKRGNTLISSCFRGGSTIHDKKWLDTRYVCSKLAPALSGLNSNKVFCSAHSMRAQTITPDCLFSACSCHNVSYAPQV
jgi:hypothetical protein